MKLLFDHNLSYKLCSKLEDLFPDSVQVREVGLEKASDLEVWSFAYENNYMITTQDSDFYDISLLRDHPPKILWLRCGNQPTSKIEFLLRKHFEGIQLFYADATISCLEIY